MQFLGLNPAPGATLAYRLAADAKQVSWVIRDGSGQVRELTGDAMRGRNTAGLHIVKWDLRVQPLAPLTPPPGAPAGAGGGGGGGGFGGGGNNGPFVVPGTYRATLRVDGKDVQTVNVAVKGDPDITITDADRRTWFEAANGLHDLQAQANGAAQIVQNASAQMTLLTNQTRNATIPPDVKKSMDSLTSELERLRRRLGLGGGGGGFGGGNENVRGRIGQLKGAIMGSTSAPTATQTAQIREVRAALPKVIEDAEAAGKRVPGLVRDLIGAGVIFTPVK